jgi:hypothetical protein
MSTLWTLLHSLQRTDRNCLLLLQSEMEDLCLAVTTWRHATPFWQLDELSHTLFAAAAQ